MTFVDDLVDEAVTIVAARLNRRIEPDKKDHAWDMLGYLGKVEREVMKSAVKVKNAIYRGNNNKPEKNVVVEGVVEGDDISWGNYVELKGGLFANKAAIGSHLTIDGCVLAGDNLKMETQITVKGLLLCGENVHLHDYAFIRGPVILGDNVQVSAEVKNSIILQDTFAVH